MDAVQKSPNLLRDFNMSGCVFTKSDRKLRAASYDADVAFSSSPGFLAAPEHTCSLRPPHMNEAVSYCMVLVKTRLTASSSSSGDT